MPTINEVEEAVVPTTTVPDAGVVDAKVVEQPGTEALTEKVVEKVKKIKKEKKAKKESTEKGEEKIEFARPPIEQITDDYEKTLVDFNIGGHPLVKLGYKCGKIIYGLKATAISSKGKDFRCIAFKARKKSKSVDGKSRGVFFFGINQQTAKELVKEHHEIKISTFGKCSVQSQTPVELVLDRITFTEKFVKDQDKVNKLLKILTKATCESKKEQLESVVTKIKDAEKKAAEPKKEKKKK